MENHSLIKKNKLLIHRKTWMNHIGINYAVGRKAVPEGYTLCDSTIYDIWKIKLQ